ncbi:MAG: N-6 DNA methylase [Armatimonadota bacterium]
MASARTSRNGRQFNSQQSLNSAIKSICDIMRRSNCAGALQYVPELTWILFLRILDEREEQEAEQAEAVGADFTPSLRPPYRWRDWAAPWKSDGNGGLLASTDGNGSRAGWKRHELEKGALGAFMGFVNEDLIPQLKALGEKPNATGRQKVISQIFSGVERVRIDSESNLCNVLDEVHEISQQGVDTTHIFTLSQVYEGLLLKMGERGNDGGQFFTPREIIRAMVQVVDPEVGETVYDPGCGTGGFLAQAYEHMRSDRTPTEIETLKRSTFYGREKDNLIYPIALANLVLHEIDEPHIWHGNTLTGDAAYDGLFQGAPDFHDVILMNPPFGGKEGKTAQTHFDFKTGATQVLFLQHVIRSLKPGGRCGIVLDEGVLFRTNENAFVKTKTRLLDECDLWCLVSLPPGTFVNAGAGVKTNLLFFTKGQPTERIWYYDLSDIKVGKKSPLTLQHFEEFFRLLPERADSEHSWTVDMVRRKQEVAEAARPLKEQAAAKKSEAAEWSDRLKELRKATPREDGAIEEAETRFAELTREARELTARATDIENAVYDLKAVNPNAKSNEDTRTPEELLDLMEAKGREVAEAVAELRRLGGAGL